MDYQVYNQDGSAVYVDPADRAPQQRQPMVLQNDSIMLYDNMVPSPADFDGLLAPIPGSQDLIWKTYYDSVALTSGASQQYSFFVNPAVNSGLWRSNFTGASGGVLPGNNRFLVYSLMFWIVNDVTTTPLNVVTVKEIMRVSNYSFMVQDKSYSDDTLMKFLDPRALPVVNTNYYAVNPFASVRLPIQVPIAKQYSFRVDFSTTGNPSLSNNWYLFCGLSGVLYRSIQ